MTSHSSFKESFATKTSMSGEMRSTSPYGAEWQLAIAAGLEPMDVLLVLVTSDSAGSEWVQKECLEFVHRQKPVVPYVVESQVKNALPDYLRSIQYIDGTETTGFSTLAQRLRLLLAH